MVLLRDWGIFQNVDIYVPLELHSELEFDLCSIYI